MPAVPRLPRHQKMVRTFQESKETLYSFVDSVDHEGWPEQFEATVRARIRMWLREQQAPGEEIAELADSMGLTKDQLGIFTKLLNEEIELLSTAHKEEPDAKNKPGRASNAQSFSLASQMRKRPRLSKEETAQNILLFQDGAKAEKQLKESDQELGCAERRKLESLVEKGRKAQEALIAGNWGLIMCTVEKYAGMGVPNEDLEQEGILGLLRAMESYIPEKSAFSTYATPWIKKFVLNAVTTQGRPIPLSVATVTLLRRIKHTAASCEARTGVTPAAQEIADNTGYSVKRIKNATRNEKQSQSVSMEMLINSETDNYRLLDTIADPNSEAQYDSIFEQKREIDIRKVLHASLLPLEEKIVLILFGIEDGKSRPMNDLGIVLGYTKENIRQIRKNATEKLGDLKSLTPFAAA